MLCVCSPYGYAAAGLAIDSPRHTPERDANGSSQSQLGRTPADTQGAASHAGVYTASKHTAPPAGAAEPVPLVGEGECDGMGLRPALVLMSPENTAPHSPQIIPLPLPVPHTICPAASPPPLPNHQGHSGMAGAVIGTSGQGKHTHVQLLDFGEIVRHNAFRAVFCGGDVCEIAKGVRCRRPGATEVRTGICTTLETYARILSRVFADPTACLRTLPLIFGGHA